MFRPLQNNRAQATFGEYALIFILVIGMMTAMGVYFKRLIQGRLHDARNYTIYTVRDRASGYFNGNLYLEYEPYYSNVASFVSRSSDTQSNLVAGGVTGIFRENINDKTSLQTYSVTLPPMNAD